MATQRINSNFFQEVGASSFSTSLVVPLTRTIFNYLPAAATPKWVRRIVFRAALKRAYISFASYYPQWAAALFDEHFLQHGAMSLLAGYVQEGYLPQASELARVWDAQLGPNALAVRERRIAELTPVAASFLDWLALELAAWPFLVNPVVLN